MMTPTRFELSQKFYFEAAHTLDRDINPEGSKRIHGHTYQAEVTVAAPANEESGMVMDLDFLRQEVNRVRDLLDHRFLDEVENLGPATLENICAFVFRQLKSAVPTLVQVFVERPSSGDKCSLRPVG